MTHVEMLKPGTHPDSSDAVNHSGWILQSAIWAMIVVVMAVTNMNPILDKTIDRLGDGCVCFAPIHVIMTAAKLHPITSPTNPEVSIYIFPSWDNEMQGGSFCK